MRSICDIIIFKTPFEKENSFKEKHEKIKEMFEDYVTNSGIPLKKTDLENDFYNIYTFENINLNIKIVFSFKKDLSKKEDYLPSWMVNYYLDTFKFEKQNIESFLNDNIKFIYNVFFNNFFVDYDKNFVLDDYNKWKKLDFDSLWEFDLEYKTSDKNKQLLDSMMYVYFDLYKNIFEINKNEDYLEKVKSGKDLLLEYKSNLELFKNRNDIVKKQLIDRLTVIEHQLNTFINFIS